MHYPPHMSHWCHPCCSPQLLHLPCSLLTLLALPAHSPHWHNTTWLTSLAPPASLLPHSPCLCHQITPLTLSTLPILLTPPTLLTPIIVPTAHSSQSMPPFIVIDSVKYHPVRSGYSLRNLSISHA